MLTNYGYIGIFLIASIALAFAIVILPIVLRWLKVIPHAPNEFKYDTYECGMETVGRSWVQFNFRYYVYALMLIAMDVLVVFLYPWAARLEELGTTGLIVVSVFIAIVMVGYLYAWKKRMLEWK